MDGHSMMNRLLLAAILLVAFAVRLPGLRAGMPCYIAPNEAEIMAVASGIFKGDLNPHNWWWGSLYFYVNALIIAVTHATRIGLSILHLTDLTSTPYWWFFVASRLVNVVFAATSVYFIYRIGLLLGTRTLGLLSAGICAVMPAHFSISPEMKPDVLMLMLITVESYCALRAYVKHSHSGKWLLAAAACSGLALGTKYVFVAPITWVCAKWLRDRRDGLPFFNRELIMAGLCSIAGFFLASPFALICPLEFIGGTLFQNSEYSNGHPGADSMPSALFFVKYLFLQGLTPALFCAALVGVVAMVRHRRGGALAIIAAAPVAWAAVLSTYTINFPHHTALLSIPASIAAAWLLCNTRQLWFAALLGAAVVVQPAIAAATSMAVRSRPDIRIAAAEWIDRNLPHGSSIAREDYTPFVSGSKFRCTYIGICGSAYFDADSARRAGYDFIMTASHDRFFSRPAQYGREIRNYEEQLRQFTCVKRFDPGKRYRGTAITILKVR